MKLWRILNQFEKIIYLLSFQSLSFTLQRLFTLTLEFRMKERTSEEIQKDLLDKKIFDMTIEIKGLSLLSPENGIYTQFVS